MGMSAVYHRSKIVTAQSGCFGQVAAFSKKNLTGLQLSCSWYLANETSLMFEQRGTQVFPQNPINPE